MIQLRAICFVVLPMLALPAYADPVLESASSFAVLAGSATTNTGSTTITGDYGVWAGSSLPMTGITLIPPSAAHATDSVAQLAQSDLTTAILGLSSEGPGNVLSASDFTAGTVTLLPGVFSTVAKFDLTGTLTLDFENLSNASFVFLIGSSLTAETGSTVALENVGSNDSVFWVMPAAGAQIKSGATFEGNILANTSITFGTGATLNCGRALASTGDVTMDTNTISIGCESALVTTGGGVPTAGNALLEGSKGLSGGTGGIIITPPSTRRTTPPIAPGGSPLAITPVPAGVVVPEPGSFLLLGTGLLGIGLFVRRKMAA